MATPFTQLIGSLASREGGFTVNATDDWRQGRTLYGGVSAALCLAAVQKTFGDLPPLRSAQISFVGPAAGEVELRPTLLRQGKSTTFAACDLLSEGQVGTHAVFCFAAPRASIYARTAPRAPTNIPRPETCEPFFPPGLGPVFRQHFDTRLAVGGRPMAGAEPDMWIWTRHVDPAASSDAIALLALADAPPPAAMVAFTTPVMISTMTWMLEIVDAEALQSPGWKLLRSTAETITDGYSAQSMTIWDEDGRTLVVARQSVAVFG